jgi:hypothetical protein
MHYRLGDHELLLIDDFLDSEEASQLLQQLLDALPWRQDRITIFGREHPIPREQCWIAGESMTYRYSGQTLTPTLWPDWLRPLRGACFRGHGRSLQQRARQPIP